MGAEQSNIIPMPSGFDFMTVTFKGTDQIRLTYPTEQDINTTREVIIEHWPKGISLSALSLMGSNLHAIFNIAFIINEELICLFHICCIAFVIDEEIICMFLLLGLRLLSMRITLAFGLATLNTKIFWCDKFSVEYLTKSL